LLKTASIAQESALDALSRRLTFSADMGSKTKNAPAARSCKLLKSLEIEWWA
jgi:hypothetical protein